MNIFNLLGTPRESEMYFVRNQDCKRVIQSWGRKKRRPWSSIYPTAEPQALDLLVSEILFKIFLFWRPVPMKYLYTSTVHANLTYHGTLFLLYFFSLFLHTQNHTNTG